jgi:hypothetical protein
MTWMERNFSGFVHKLLNEDSAKPSVSITGNNVTSVRVREVNVPSDPVKGNSFRKDETYQGLE